MDEQLTFEFAERPTIKGFPELRWTGKRPYRSTQYYPAQLREQSLSDYKVDVQIVDILRDKSELQLKREAEAEVTREGNKLVIHSFYPMNLMQKLSLQKVATEYRYKRGGRKHANNDRSK